MKKSTLLFKVLHSFLFLLCAYTLSAQSGTLTGNISDEDGPLIGATVEIVGEGKGTITDLDGNFSINLEPGDYTLEASYAGYEALQKAITVTSGQNSVDFSLAAGVLLGDVVVTGTRARPRTAISSAAPIDNFVGAVIEKQGNGDLTENLKNIVPSYTATPLTGDGAAFVRPTSLRGLPPDQTLVLVNSKRRHRSALIAHFGAAMNVGAHAVDIGHIPSIAVKNLEVLRDGAAAQYGSDAIAGVFNFILKDANRGGQIQAQVGQWYGRNYGAETDYKIAANYGLPLTKKGFFNISGEYGFNAELKRGDQHSLAVDLEGAPDPVMNWGRPESSGFRSIWNAGIEITPEIDLYSFGNYANTYGNYSFFFREPNKTGVLTPVPTNPTDPSQGNFSWADEFPLGFTPRLEGFQNDFSSITGIKGQLPAAVNYDVSASFGYNRINYKLNGTLNPSFGPDSQRDFEPGDLQQFERNINLDLSKEFMEKINVAVGAQLRAETYTMYEGDKQSYEAGPWAGVGNLIDPIATANDTADVYYNAPAIGANGLAGTSARDAGAFDGSSWGAYVDVEYDITDALLVQAAYRHEDFKNFGSADNFKIAARYTVSDQLTLRGGVSTGFHAPTPGQANVVTITTSFDGVTGEQVQEGTVSPTSELAMSLGGKELAPETSLNFSLGLASRITDDLSLTLDVYQIEVDDRLIKSRSLPIVNPLFSELAFYTNSLNTRTQGADLVASWRGKDTDVSLAFNYNATKVLGQEQVNGIDPVSEGTIFNLENNLPKVRANASVTHDFGVVSSTLRANFYGGTIDERGDKEEVSSAVLVDAEVIYPATDKLRFILGANNLLNTYPDEIATRASQGMPFPRRTPIGYHGGMVYLRAIYKL